VLQEGGKKSMSDWCMVGVAWCSWHLHHVEIMCKPFVHLHVQVVFDFCTSSVARHLSIGECVRSLRLWHNLNPTQLQWMQVTVSCRCCLVTDPPPTTHHRHPPVLHEPISTLAVC
jgi:hypothetical protein